MVDYTITQGIIHQKQAVIRKNKRYVDITYITDKNKLDNDITIKVTPTDNYKLGNVNTSKLVYTYTKISDEISFTSMSDARLIDTTTIKNTRTNNNYLFDFTVKPKSDLSYLIIDYPHLKIDTSTIELSYFDSDNNQYKKAEILTGNFRSIKRIGSTRINRVAVKIMSGKDNTIWKVSIGGLLTRLDNIEIVSIGIRNSKYENFIKKNMYSREEIKELKETYPEMVWNKGLLEDGIQFEIRVKRDSLQSDPQVKKLLTINVLDDVVKANHNDIDEKNKNTINLLRYASSKIVTGMTVYFGNKTNGKSNSWTQLRNEEGPITVKSFNNNIVQLSGNYTDTIPADVDIKFQNNSIVAKKSRNDSLYRSTLHNAERTWYKGDQWVLDFASQPTDNARDNLYYNFFNDSRIVPKEKSTKYNFYNLIPGWDYAKVKEIYMRVKYSLQQNEKTRYTSDPNNNTVNFLKAATENERIQLESKTEDSKIYYRLNDLHNQEIYQISDDIRVRNNFTGYDTSTATLITENASPENITITNGKLNNISQPLTYKLKWKSDNHEGLPTHWKPIVEEESVTLNTNGTITWNHGTKVSLYTYNENSFEYNYTIPPVYDFNQDITKWSYQNCTLHKIPLTTDEFPNPIYKNTSDNEGNSIKEVVKFPNFANKENVVEIRDYGSYSRAYQTLDNKIGDVCTFTYDVFILEKMSMSQGDINFSNGGLYIYEGTQYPTMNDATPLAYVIPDKVGEWQTLTLEYTAKTRTCCVVFYGSGNVSYNENYKPPTYKVTKPSCYLSNINLQRVQSNETYCGKQSIKEGTH